MTTILLFAGGLVLGGQINRAIYRLAWNPRPIGPWSVPHPKAPPRAPSDRLPVFGWLGLAREEKALGLRYFWVRPIFIELACAIGLALLFQWVMDGGQHTWVFQGRPIKLMPDQSVLYGQFVLYAVFFALLTIATFIDFDEKTIPDEIVIPGTLFAFLMAAVFPATRLPFWQILGLPDKPVAELDFLKLTSPLIQPDGATWDPRLDGPWGLGIGILCLIGWWYALTPKTVCFRHGLFKAVCYHLASIPRRVRRNRPPFARFMMGLTAGCILLTVGVWQWGGDHWVGLLSAIVGMAFGGGLVWAFRIVASYVLAQEALGFGDVTLMGMIGAFVGWQSALLIFFMAPFAGAVIALIQLLLTREREIAFGPYLCAATAVLIFCWNPLWTRSFIYFEVLGVWVPVGLVLCLAVLAILLSAYLKIKSLIISRLEARAS